MIKNYIKTAFRTLMKNKGFTVLNVLGLALGLAACLLIVFYVVDELSYDKYNVNAERIYRVTDNVSLNGRMGSYAPTEAPLEQALKTGFPEIEKTTRLIDKEGIAVSAQKFFFRKGNENIQEN